MTDIGTFASGTDSPLGVDPIASPPAQDAACAYFRIDEPNVIFQTFDQEVVAVHLSTGSYHTLPGIAGESFLMLSGSGSCPREMAARLAARYAVEPAAAENDLQVFIGELLAQSMIVAIGAPASPNSASPKIDPLAAAAFPEVLPQAQLAPYLAPRLESFSDLEGLVLIDPVHDVDVAGWPNVAPGTPIEEEAENAEGSQEAGNARNLVLPLMRCRLAGPNIIFERFNNETVAMDLGSGSYHSLSGEAEDIFLLMPSEPTTWQIRDAVARKYAVEMGELESALRDYLNQLEREGLIRLEKLDTEIAAPALHLNGMTPNGIQNGIENGIQAETQHGAQAENQNENQDGIPNGIFERLPFNRPRIEAFVQPSFDGSFGEDVTFSHEQPAQSTEPDEDAAEDAAGREADTPARRRYAIRTGDLIYSTAGGETVISDRDEGRYYKLNQPASDVFALLKHKPGVNEIFTALERRYAVPEQNLRVALMILLWNLRKVGLVSLERGPAPAIADAESAAPESSAPESAGPDSSAPDSSAPQLTALAEPLPFQGFHVAMYHDLRELLRPFNPTPAATIKPKVFRARQFVSLLECYFEEAASACGPETQNATSEESFQVAGERLTIRCAGASQTAELRRAFHHLKADAPEAGGLTIGVWSNGIVPCGPFLEPVLSLLYENWSILCGPRGELLEFDCGEIAVIYHPGPDVLSVLDKQQNKAFYLMRDNAPLPFWELSSPFRHILHPWFSTRGLQYTHAGAVGTLHGGVLLAGKGGSGKSTTSLLCASAGMLYAADDYCLTRPADAQVFSLYSTAKLKGPEDLERLPQMSGRSFNEDSFEHGGVGKGTFNLLDLWPERMAASFPLRAILLPTVTDRVESRLEPCSPADALVALTPSTLAQLPFSGEPDCLRLAELANKVPAYRLYLGADLDQIPRVIGDLLP